MQVSSPTGSVTQGRGEKRSTEEKKGLFLPIRSHAVLETNIYISMIFIRFDIVLMTNKWLIFITQSSFSQVVSYVTRK